MITVTPGDLLFQPPRTRVVYTLPLDKWGLVAKTLSVVSIPAGAATAVEIIYVEQPVSRLRPSTTVQIAVSGGIAGAAYRVMVTPFLEFEVRIRVEVAS